MVNLARQLAQYLLEAKPKKGSGESAKDFIARAAAKKKEKTKIARYRSAPIDPDETPAWAVTAKQELEEDQRAQLDITSIDQNQAGVQMESLGWAGEQGMLLYRVFENSDAARNAAIDEVEIDLQQSPENFNQAWLQGFINLDRLRQDLHSDTYDMNYERWNDERDIVAALIERNLLDEDEFYKDGDEVDLTPELERKIETAKEEAAEADTSSQLEDPIGYLEDIYGREDAVKHAIGIAGINHREAAESAVDGDGTAHFLAHYDSNEIELPSGAVAYRCN
jgi:hypothetical protein